MLNLVKISNQKRADFIGFLAVGLSAVAQFVLSPVVKFYIGVEGLGMWHLLFQTFSYLQIVDLGLSNGIVREIAAVKAKEDKKLFCDAAFTARRGLTLAGIAFALLGGAACFLLPNFIDISSSFKTDFLTALGLLSCWGLFRYRYSLSLLGLRATNRIVAFNIMNLISGPGRPVMGIIFLTFKMGLTGIAIGYVLVEAAVRFISSKLQKFPLSSGNYNRSQFLRMLTFGGATSVVSVSNLVIFFSSSFIIGWKLGVKEVAVYQSTIAFLWLIARFAIIPFANLLPGFIFHFERNEIGILLKKGRRSHIIFMLIVLILLALVCFLNKAFVTMWVGEELFGGYHFTIIYGAFLFLSIAKHNGYMMYQSTGRLRPMVIGHLIEIPLNIGLSIILINKFGLQGIAYAYVLATLPVTFISQVAFSSNIGPLSRRLSNNDVNGF